MGRYENLIGQRFGMLVVREALHAKNGNRYWLCDCDCGKTSNVTTGNLKSGYITSCGCLKCPDLTGQTFGKRTVLRKSEERITRGSKKRVAWECRCQCGNVVLRTSDSLIEDKERMCSECSHQNSADKAFQSAARRVDNTSGHTGISFRKNKWEARICHNKRRYMLGRFDTLDEAIAERSRAEDFLKRDPDAFVEYYSKNYQNHAI